LEFLYQLFSYGYQRRRLYISRYYRCKPRLDTIHCTKDNTGGDVFCLEYDLINEFKRLSSLIIQQNLPQSDFEWLFLAQHYGLPTRLLDWCTNPLVALFFASKRHDEINGAVYTIKIGITDQYEIFDPYTADFTEAYKNNKISVFALQTYQGHTIFVKPKYTDQRYYNQRSVFSCSNNPYLEFDLSGIEKLEFKGSWKPELRDRLRTLGISASFIYPGLSGIANELKSFIFDPVASGHLKIITSRLEIKF
jgi:hypothetical protein